MATEADGKKSPAFRCLTATRYAVASVVTVLILLVVVKAVGVVCRPNSLSLGVGQGVVFRRQLLEQPTRLLLEFSLQFYNPSIRTIVYYTNIKAYLFDKNTSAWSSHPAHDSLVYFLVRDRALNQQGRVDSYITAEVARSLFDQPSVFDFLYYGKTDAYMSDITMRLDGNLITEIRSGFNTTPRLTTFYCWPLLLGLDPRNIAQVLTFNLKDVFCREAVQDTHFI